MDNNITAKEQSQELTKTKKRNHTKNIALLLYRDNADHAVALAKVKKKWDYTYILHDKDEYEDDTELHDVEQLKKAHYHVLIHLPTQREPKQIARELGLDDRFVRKVTDRTAMLVYLIHTGMYDKYQYSPKEVMSNRPSLFYEALSSVKTSSEKLEIIIDIIQNKNCTTVSFAYKMLIREGYTEFALKHHSLIKDLVNDLWEERKISQYHSLGLAGYDI